MVLPEKNLSSPPPQKKKKAVGLALSVRKNSGLARPKKKELAPFEIENRGASVIRQGQLARCKLKLEPLCSETGYAPVMALANLVGRLRQQPPFCGRFDRIWPFLDNESRTG